MLSYDKVERVGAPATAVLTHPHPDYGGNRYHPIIDALYRRLPISTLRFDFRSSDFDAAHAEVREAIALANGPVVLIGYSFGADVALSVDDPTVLGWFLVAPPLRWTAGAVAAGDARPKYLLVPDHDEYSPPSRATEVTAAWHSTTIAHVAGDHFLVGRAEEVVDAALAWLPTVPGAATPT